MKRRILNAFFNLLLASLLSHVIYLVLSALVRALLSGIESVLLQQFLLSTFTSASFAGILFCFTKLLRGVGTKEVLEDYRDAQYISFWEDTKIVLRREKMLIILIASVISACFLFIKLDMYVLGKTGLYMLTMPFTLMYMYSFLFPKPIDFIGYILTFIVMIAFYVLFVAWYRRTQYRMWLKKESSHAVE